MSIKKWFFYSALICLVFLAGRVSAAKPKTATVSTKIDIPKYEAPKWEPIVKAQLARRDAQEQARKAQLQAAQAAEAARLAAIPKPKPKPIQTASIKPQTVTAPVDTNAAKMYIYMHESGNNPKAKNSAGCLGLGQACPGSKLLAVCPNLDYACEDQFFTSYMLGRYKTWENAYAFWLANHWW